MPISDHYRGGSTERLIVQIITVDPSSGRIEGVGKDAAVIQIGNARVPAIFRWPVQGEYWSIIRDNGIWVLEAMIPNPDDINASNLNPGDALIQAKTIWTPDGERLIKTGDVAGGILSGTYPNPTFAADMATQTELDTINTSLGNRITALEAPQPQCFLRKTATTALTSGTTADISFETEDYDPLGMHSGTSNIITVPIAGLYHVSAMVILALPGAAAVWSTVSNIKYNGVVGPGDEYSPMLTGAGSQPILNYSWPFRCAAGDTFSLTGFWNGGSAGGVVQNGSLFSVVRLGPL